MSGPRSRITRFRHRASTPSRRRSSTTCSRCSRPTFPGIVPGTSGYVRNNYISAGTTISPNNKYSVKGDQVLTSKQRISFFFERTREQDLYGPTGAPGLPEPLAGNPGYNRSDVYRLSYDYTLTPTLLNRFYAGGNNWEQNHGSVRHLQRGAAGPGHSHHQHSLEQTKGFAYRIIPPATTTSRRSTLRTASSPPGAWPRPTGRTTSWWNSMTT